MTENRRGRQMNFKEKRTQMEGVIDNNNGTFVFSTIFFG
jgi:hypothetical protein